MVLTNPALTLTDISCGKGLGFIPSAVDGASSHSGKLSLETKSKHKNGLLDHNWSCMKFEEVADGAIVSWKGNEGERFRNFGRPYLMSTGIEEEALPRHHLK